MDKIKAFFQKKKLDVKFKNAGVGHNLHSSPGVRPPAASRPQESQRKPPPDALSVQAQQSAAEAALKRLEVTSKQPPSRSSQAIKAQARKQLEDEQHATESFAKPTGPERKTFDAAPVLAVGGVYFTCELLGDDLYLTKSDMCEAVECFLSDTFDEDPIVSSTLMIHSLNPNKYTRDACIDVLTKYLDNLIQSPHEEKYRKIRKSNKIFQEKVVHINGAEKFLQAVGFAEKEENGEPFLVINEETCAAERLLLAKDCLANGQPVPLKLYRNPIPLKHDCRPLDDEGLPLDFFERSSHEIKAEQQAKSDEVERMLTLRTREMRERDEIKRIYKYRYTLLRIRFPDGYMLQGTFKSTEKIDDVERFVRENIDCDWAPFVLKNVFGETFKGVKLEKTLAELELSPASVLQFELDAQLIKDYAAAGQQLPKHYLKPELIAEADESS